MKYFIDTHDKAKGSFPPGELSEEEFFAQFDALEAVAPNSKRLCTRRTSI